MIRLCISSQTPPAQSIRDTPAPAGHTWELGRDYVPQLGGVVPMMRALLGAGQGKWIAPNPRWLSLSAPGLPPEFRTSEGYTVETLTLEPEVRAEYNQFKEAIWRSFHGPQGLEPMTEFYRAFVEYNYRMADLHLKHVPDCDLFYVNDFQNLLVGGLIGSAAPALLRWHIPLEFRGYPEPVRRFFLKAMEGFDAIVVSTRSYLEELIRAGFHGRAFQVYPYFDPREQGVATPSAVRAFRDRLGLGDDPIVLSVGRMDPVKRQDILIEAFATARRHHPKARLLLVGGGSFTTSTLSAGLGENKADAWLAHLHEVVRQRHLPEGAVVFAGGVSPPDLLAAYSASDLFVHPAPWEGFGLVVVEAWTHRLPVVVTRGAGVAELVDDELNGYVVPGESSNALARKIDYLLSHRDEAQRMGAAGALTARRCHVQRAAGRLEEVFERTIRNYENNGLRPGSLRSR